MDLDDLWADGESLTSIAACNRSFLPPCHSKWRKIVFYNCIFTRLERLKRFILRTCTKKKKKEGEFSNSIQIAKSFSKWCLFDFAEDNINLHQRSLSPEGRGVKSWWHFEQELISVIFSTSSMWSSQPGCFPAWFPTSKMGNIRYAGKKTWKPQGKEGTPLACSGKTLLFKLY